MVGESATTKTGTVSKALAFKFCGFYMLDFRCKGILCKFLRCRVLGPCASGIFGGYVAGLLSVTFFPWLPQGHTHDNIPSRTTTTSARHTLNQTKNPSIPRVRYIINPPLLLPHNCIHPSPPPLTTSPSHQPFLSSLPKSSCTQEKIPHPTLYLQPIHHISTTTTNMASPNLNGSYLQQADPQHFPTNATGAPPPNNYTAPATAQPEQQTQSQEVPKDDEVGWYFVEQYYTTLNKTPERLNVCCSA